MNILWLLMIIGSLIAGAATGRIGDLLPAMTEGSARGIALVIELAAAYGLWMGFLEVARKAGLLRGLARILGPFIRWLFPGVDPAGPAGEAIATNLSANMLGMGNAATPAGLSAMAHLAGAMRDARATDAMCAFLVVNCSSIQLYPTTVVALRQAAGAVRPADIVIPALIATCCSTLAGIAAVKCMAAKGGRSP